MFRSNYRAVERFVAGQFPNADQAEVMSLTFTTAWRRFDDLPEDTERGWLIGIARNTARNSLRSRRRRRAATDRFRAEPQRTRSRIYDEAVPLETRERLDAALAQLRAKDREVIELAAVHGLRGSELAEALGVSVNSAQVRLHRARKRLSALFEAEVSA